MKIVLRGKSKTDNDRAQRYNALLKNCKTASECLLKSCSYFEMVGTQSVENEPPVDAMDVDKANIEESGEAGDEEVDEEMDGGHEEGPKEGHGEGPESSVPAAVVSETCGTLVAVRQNQMQALIVELESTLLHAAWLAEQCGRAPNPELQGTHYHQWKSEMKSTGLRDPEATSNLRRYLGEAPKNVDADTEEIYYRDPPTAEELQKEKKAADKRKKQAKAKRTAERKAKKADENNQGREASKKSNARTRKSKIRTAPEADHAEEGHSDDESGNSDDNTDLDPPDPKPDKIRDDDFVTYASNLRKLTGHLRSLVTELTSRTRSLRFARGAQELYEWYIDSNKPPQCRSCNKVVFEHDEISVNIRCGHLTCEECIERTGHIVCAVNGCGEGAESFRLRKVMDLVGDGTARTYGSRLGNIITLINSLPQDDQVLLFVQFEDVMLSMAAQLNAAKISNYALKAGRRMVDMMNDFQENEGEDKKKVLLLNPANATAAGM